MIVLILILGLALRLISLNQSLWLDEATSIVVARDFSYNEILTKFSPGDFHPPLYYLLLKVWMKIFGSTEVAARSMSVFFGIVTIWLIYKIAQRLITSHKSLIANYFPAFSALLLATSPLHIYYSQEARMYSAATLFTSIVVYFVAKIIFGKRFETKNFIWLTIFSVLLLYTDYLPVFFLIVFFAYLAFYQKKYLRHLFLWFGITAVFFFPWISTFLTQLQGGIGVRESAPLWWMTLGKTNIKELTLVPVKFIIGRISSFDKVFYSASVAVASIPFTVSFLQSLYQFSKTRTLWFWFLGPLFLAAIFGFFFSGFSYFRLIFVLPAFYLLAAYGALSFKSKIIKHLLVGSLILVNFVCAGIYLFNRRFHREDWRSAVSFIENNSETNSVVVFVSKNQRDAYHYYAQKVPSFGREGVELGFNQIFLMRYVQPIFDPKDEVRAKIENRGYTKVEENDFNGIVVWRYQK